VDTVNSLYDRARVELLTARIDWNIIDLVVSAWSGTPNFVATDTSIHDLKLRGANELGYSLPINGTSVWPDGSAQTDTVLIPEVPIGPDITWFTMAKKLPTHDDSTMILFVDDAEGLPFVTNGLDVVINPDWLQQRGWFKP
jgi:hypothetical protein